MPSPQAIDIEALLVPIVGENPSGADLRYVGPYDAIQEARRADDTLPQGDWRRETKTADWLAVIQLATDVLATKSKDLQVAGWLVEALVKQQGFPGLRDGLRLLQALQQRFWQSLYPTIEEGDLDSRAGPLYWLNEKLPPSIKAIPITRTMDGVAYSWLLWEESRTVDNLAHQSPEAYQEALAEGKLSGEQFDKAVAGTPGAFYETLYEDLQQSWEAWEQLSKEVDKQFGKEAPSLLNIKKALEDCQVLVQDIVKKKRQLEPHLISAQAAHSAESSLHRYDFRPSESFPSESVPFVPQDRADALHRLSAVADFFRRTEPHSPVAYLVQRAVQWGGMPLEAWLEEVISDDVVLARIRETLGLKGQDTPHQSE